MLRSPSWPRARSNSSISSKAFDPDWIDADTRRVAYYTNIPPGRYQFRVIACNNDGLWNNEGVTWPSIFVRISIRPGGSTFVHWTGSVRRYFCLEAASPVLRLREIELTRRVEDRTRELQLEIAERRRAEAALSNAKESAERLLARRANSRQYVPRKYEHHERGDRNDGLAAGY